MSTKKSKMFTMLIPERMRARIEAYREKKMRLPISAIIMLALDDFLERNGF